MTYADFLAAKRSRVNEVGPVVALDAIHPLLHEWQAEIDNLLALEADIGHATLFDGVA